MGLHLHSVQLGGMASNASRLPGGGETADEMPASNAGFNDLHDKFHTLQSMKLSPYDPARRAKARPNVSSGDMAE